MALSTYAELKASIADWLHRSDLTTVIPDFVTLLEAELNRKLNLRYMETDAALVTVVNQAYSVAPTDMIEPLAVYINWGSGKRQLVKKSPESLPYGTYTCAPDYWALDGANIRYATPIDSTTTYSLSIRYRQKLAISTPTTAATWLLTNYPDLYLYGSLLQAAPYTIDDDRIPMWRTIYGRVLQDVRTTEGHGQEVTAVVDSALLRHDPGLTQRIFGG